MLGASSQKNAKGNPIDSRFNLCRYSTQDIVAGFFLIEVKTKEEAIEWARRVPDPMGNGESQISILISRGVCGEVGKTVKPSNTNKYSH